ncbi:VOC family protein [Microbacterium aurum]
MDQRISLVTLGVADLDRSIAFYRAIGWEPHPRSVAGEIAFYQAGGLVFALWSRVSLAEDSGVADGGGWGGITLAHNVLSPDDVDAILAAAGAAGARIARTGAPTEWGGYSGVFIDLDGHPWEVAINPGWPIADDGSILLP